MIPSTQPKLPQSWWQSPELRYRLDVLSRFSAAVLGGYLLTAALTAVLPLLLPLRLTDAVLLTLALSVLFYALAFLWVFWVKKLRTAWLGMLAPSAGLGLLLLLLKGWL
jgi:hypothetical protein